MDNLKEGIRQDFRDHNCYNLWRESWDFHFVTHEMIVYECIKKYERLLKCGDVTPSEGRFIDMVNIWD